MSEFIPDGGAAPVEAPVDAPVEENVEETEGNEEEVTEETPEELEAKSKEAEKKAEAARRKKYQLKVNNKVRDIELDLDNDEEVAKYLQKAMAADEKFQEAAMTRKQAEALVEMLKKDPLSVLKHPSLGVDIKALAQKVINDELEEMEKTPEQKEREKLEKELKELKAERERLAKEKQESEMARMQAQAHQELDEQIDLAIRSTDLPKSPYVVKRIADAMIDAVGMGYEDITVQDIMPYVEEQIRNEISEMFGAMPDEVMEKLLGKGRLDNYRKARVAKVKAKPVETAKQVKDSGKATEAKKEAAKEDPKKDIKFKDFFGSI